MSGGWQPGQGYHVDGALTPKRRCERLDYDPRPPHLHRRYVDRLRLETLMEDFWHPKKKKTVSMFSAEDILYTCPFCDAWAVVELTPALKAKQEDGTTHVCHPGFGGCNQGFIKDN